MAVKNPAILSNKKKKKKKKIIIKLAHLQYVCNIYAMFWKDPTEGVRGVDFTKYTLLTSTD